MPRLSNSLQSPVVAETNVFFRNGGDVSMKHWNGRWVRETRFSQYAADGTRSDFSVSEASDFNGSVTNAISHSDFLGRGIVQTTPLETATNIYDGASSRVLCTVSSASPAVTNLYNDLGEGIGMTSAGVTTLSLETYETLSNEIWRVLSRFQIAGGTTNGLGVSHSQLTGLSNSLRRREVMTDASGATTETTAVFDPQSDILVETSTTDAHTPVVRKKRHGRDVEIHDATGLYYLKRDPFGRQYMRRFDNGAFSGGYPLDAVIFNDCGDRVLSAVCEFNSATFLVKSFDYDVFGNLVATEDELGGTVIRGCDALGNLVSQSGTAAYPVRYDYDTLGRMKTLGTRRSGEDWDETQWSRDLATGLVTAKTYADDSTVSYSYTPDGKPLRTTWARGAWKESAYDALGRLVRETSSDGGSAGLGYDAFNRIASASNAVATYTYANSALGVATNETVTIGGEVCTLTRSVDGRHRLDAMLLDGQMQAACFYDNEGRLSVVSNTVFSAAYAYSYRGMDVGYAITLTNGVSLKRALGRNAYRHELIRRVVNTTSTGCTNTLVYAYDDAGRRTARNADTIGYNARSEVTAATILSNSFTYAYYDIGSHTASTANSVETTYTANNLNQYSEISVPSVPSVDNLSYDLDGNLLTRDVFSYSYDAENRMIAAYSNSVCVVSNAYDYMSRRVAKWTPSHTTTFVYDGWNVIAEHTHTQTHTLTNFYVWGKDLSGTTQGAGGVGGLLAVSMGGQYYFPCHDANGNITAYVNESGSVVAEYAYDAFGDTIAKSGSMADAFAHRFTMSIYLHTPNGGSEKDKLDRDYFHLRDISASSSADSVSQPGWRRRCRSRAPQATAS